MKDLLRVADLSAADLRLLLAQADAATAGSSLDRDLLDGGIVALYFAAPCAQSGMAFQTAVTRLGGIPLALDRGHPRRAQGQRLQDSVRMMSRYARAIVVCGFTHTHLRQVAAAVPVPVVNLLSDRHAPCQSLAGLLTLRRRWGALAGRKLAYVGCGGNIAHSLMEAAALAGMDLAVATPYGLEPHPAVVARARALAAWHGTQVQVTLDPAAAVRNADAVVTDVWLSIHDPERARAARAQLLKAFRVDERLLAGANPGAVFLHCLPAHRGEEVSGEVIDGPRSLVSEQAANLLPMAQAVLSTLLRGGLGGHPDDTPVPDDTGPLAAAITDAVTHRRVLAAEAGRT